VSESRDGDGDGLPGHRSGEASGPSAVPTETTVPPTRRQATAPPAEMISPDDFPDDSPLSHGLRRADGALGAVEQAVLFVLLAAVVVTAAAAALSDRVIGVPLGRWWFDIVRGGTFSVAMIAAVFASHQQRHLAMDLVSRRLPARGRLMLRVVLALLTMAIAALLLRSGLHQHATVGNEGGDHLVSTRSIVAFLPLGAGLIIVHTLLHMMIDLDYLARGKSPPARMRSGH